MKLQAYTQKAEYVANLDLAREYELVQTNYYKPDDVSAGIKEFWTVVRSGQQTYALGFEFVDAWGESELETVTGELKMAYRLIKEEDEIHYLPVRVPADTFIPIPITHISLITTVLSQKVEEDNDREFTLIHRVTTQEAVSAIH